jgi:hypothetical protein
VTGIRGAKTGTKEGRLILRVEALRTEGIDSRSVIIGCLSKILGDTSAQALMFHLSKDLARGFAYFLAGLKRVFGLGTEPMIEHLIRCLERESHSPKARP